MEPTAELLLLVLEDPVKIGFTKNQSLIDKFLRALVDKIIPVPYARWQSVPLNSTENIQLKIKSQRAGHVLGSAYIDMNNGQ